MKIKKYFKYQVSVIVPCYNVESYLDKCLETLVNQTLESIEIIAINDKSTDNTGNKLDRWQNKYPQKIKVIHHLKNLGLSATRNTGLTIVAGECIGFVDPDDYVDLTMYEKLYCQLKINNADMTECDYTQINIITKRIVNRKNKFNTIICKKTNILEFLSRGCYVWKCLYKNNFLLKYNLKFNENVYFCEDIIFTYNVLINSPKLICLENKLYYYQMGRINQLTALSGNELYNIFKVFAYIENKLATHYNEYKLINNFFIHQKILLFFIYYRQIKKEYKFTFFTKAAYNLFSRTKTKTIYKILLINKYRKPIDYLRIPVFVVVAHIYYLFSKLFSITAKDV